MTTKVLKVGVVKTGSKFCSRVTKESVSSMGRLPCLGNLLRPQRPRQVAKESRGSRPVFLLSHPSSKVRNGNLELEVEERIERLREHRQERDGEEGLDQDRPGPGHLTAPVVRLDGP